MVGYFSAIYHVSYYCVRELQQSLSAMHQIQEEKESLSKRTKNLEANLEVSYLASFPYQLLGIPAVKPSFPY